MSTSDNSLWKIANDLRNKGSFYDFARVLHEATKQGIEPNFQEFELLIRSDPRNCSGIPFPPYVEKFIKEYLIDCKPKSILDPWSGYGINLLRLAETFKPEKSIGLTKYSKEYETAVLLDKSSLVQWKCDDPLTSLDQISEQFALVVSSLPWGMQRLALQINIVNKVVEVKDEIGNLILLKSAMLLEKNGSGIYIVLPRFFFQIGNAPSVYKSLSKFGLYVESVLSLPRGAYFPFTSADPLLVIIRKGQSQTLFVGRISDEQSIRSVLIDNIKKMKEGKEPELGLITESETFHSVESLIQDKKIEIIVKNSGLTEYRLAVIASINLPKHEQNGEEFEEKPNAMYLPLIGNSSAVASLDDLRIKPQNYAQIVLDQNVAIAPYVAQFYNSDLGLKIRNSHSIGFIPKLSKERLSQSSIYLPNIETQIEAVRTQSIISNMETQIETSKRQLWNNPRKAKEIYNFIRTLNQENAFESWLESLPFPLASILWAYNSELDSQNKTLHLLHFFEALSEFLTIISLSAYSSDMQIYQKYSATWLDNDQKHVNFQHSSFGDWVTISERLAKETRRLLADEQTREQCLNLFGRPNNEFVKMITNKAMYSALREASGFRNNWIGHTGVVNKKTWDERLILAEDILAQIRKIITDNFSNMSLLSPELSEFDKGVFFTNVKMLMGTRIIFKKNTVKTLVPMEKNSLYLLASGQGSPLKLLPLVKIMESPRTEQNACYFYNRIEKDGIRWISYHFESESEVVKPDDEVIYALSLLERKEKTN